jgi:hypothetical protein
VLAVDPEHAMGLFDLPFTKVLGRARRRCDPDVEGQGHQDGLELGSTVTVVFRDQSTCDLTVAGIFDSTTSAT